MILLHEQELIELKREIRDGMYSPLSFVIANAILQVSLATTCFDSEPQPIFAC